ncbi:MAG: hypothetical protein GDA48_01020 [Hormoscilla sp. GM102CHS1]|nr:hypothetical protein [Hormoscilla sp. GM102CHS1]
MEIERKNWQGRSPPLPPDKKPGFFDNFRIYTEILRSETRFLNSYAITPRCGVFPQLSDLVSSSTSINDYIGYSSRVIGGIVKVSR